jgi:hypothetical protein
MKAGIFLLSFLFALTVQATNTVKVVVKDQNNEPVIGAVVECVDEHKTTFTDFVGEAVIQPEAQEVVYKIESVGYETVFVKLSAEQQRDQIKVVLKPRSL